MASFCFPRVTFFYNRIFSVNSPPLTDLTAPHTIMDMRNNKRRNVLTHARVNFSQSETSSLLRRGAGGGLNFELLLWRGVNRKDPYNQCIFHCNGYFWKYSLQTCQNVKSTLLFVISFKCNMNRNSSIPG